MIVFAPIMELLAKNGWSSYRLRVEKVIPEGTIQRIRRGESINLTTIDTICRLCSCQPGDLISYVPGPEEGEQE